MPRPASAAGNAADTSASPPVLLNGPTSEVTKAMRMPNSPMERQRDFVGAAAGARMPDRPIEIERSLDQTSVPSGVILTEPGSCMRGWMLPGGGRELLHSNGPSRGTMAPLGITTMPPGLT